MKNILFPTDLSEAAQRAFIYALQLADHQGASITTLLAFKKPVIKGAHMPKTLEDFYATYDLTEFESYRDAIPPLRELAEANGFEHLEIKHVMEEGPTIPTILKIADDINADLIVMGTTGAQGLKELFLGSVSGEILEHATCPVLVVPEASIFDGTLDQIVFTTSFKDEEKKALEKVVAIAQQFGAEVHCINVDVSHTHEFTNRMNEFKKDFNGTEKLHFEVLEGNDMKKAIFQYLEAKDADIISMVTHKRSFFEELFNYSRTKQLAYHTKTPLLALPSDIL